MIAVEIDRSSGFCFGVVNAIRNAELALKKDGTLYCLGDLVHNSLEMERLKKQGLQTIDRNELQHLKDRTVLLRAHGEPPDTYEIAKRNRIKIIDATCPVVLKLQRRIFECYQAMKDTDVQLIIYGKKGHAEVNGLVGQTQGRAKVVENPNDLDTLDFSRDIILFSQTTKSLDGFGQMIEIIQAKMKAGARFLYYDTICRQVANRLSQIKEFVSRHDWVFFVAGQKSSNGRMLFEECKKTNPNIRFISDASELTETLPPDIRTVGVCGATSTPKWLMEEVADRIRRLHPYGML